MQARTAGSHPASGPPGPPSPSLQGCSQGDLPQSVSIPGIAPTQQQHPALGLTEPHWVHMGPLLQPVQILLHGFPSFRVSTAPLSLVSLANLLRVHSMPSSVTDEDVEEHRSQDRPRGTPLVASLHPDTEPLITALWLHPASQFLIH